MPTPDLSCTKHWRCNGVEPCKSWVRGNHPAKGKTIWVVTCVSVRPKNIQIESNRLYIIDYYIDYIIIWRRIYRCISLTRNGASTSNFPPFFWGSRSSSRALMVYPTKGQDPAGVGHHGVEVKAMPWVGLDQQTHRAKDVSWRIWDLGCERQFQEEFLVVCFMSFPSSLKNWI